MKHRQRTRKEILAEYKQRRADMHTVIGGRVGMITAIAVLWDYFDFSKEDIELFIDKSKELIDSYNNGNEDPSQWIESIKTEIGIDMLGELHVNHTGTKD